MIRVLPILAAVFALAVTAAPASAVNGTQTYGSPNEQIYLDIKLENVQITNYQR